MDNNQSINNKIFAHVQKSVSNEDAALWNSKKEEDKDAKEVLKAGKCKEAVEAEGILSNEDIIKLTKLLLKAFIDCDKEQRYKKAAEHGTSNILSPKERKKCEEQATETAENSFRELVKDQFNEKLRSSLRTEVLTQNEYANLSEKEIKDKEKEISKKVGEKFDEQWNTKEGEFNKQIEIQLKEQLTNNTDKKKQFEEEKQKLFEQFYLESLESQNITSLMKCYYSESIGDGSCGYVSIAKACGQKKNSGTEYARFFDVLKKFKEAVDDGIKLGKVDKWEAQFRVRTWTGGTLSDDGVLINKLSDVIQQDVKIKNKSAAYGVLAGLSSYIIKNWEMIKTVIDPESEINLDQNALSKAKEQNLINQKDKLNVAKDLLIGMKGLAQDYSDLLKKNYQNCEPEEGKADLYKIAKLPFFNFIHTVSKFYPVTINKYDIGEDYDTMRYVYRQTFMGYGLSAYAKSDQRHILGLGWNDIQTLSKRDIDQLPQSDSDLDKDIKIKYQKKDYEVQYKKSELVIPEWLEFEYLIGLSKKINKPVFCLSSNPECAGLFVFDASKINEEGNDEHLCMFIFNMSNKLSDQEKFDDKKIKYYSKLADEYNNAIKDKNNPVLFFSSSLESGHYMYLDPKDEVLRENFARDIKGAFFDRCIEENTKRQRCQSIICQANKIRELRDQINGLNAEQAKKNEIASKEQNDREQKLNEKEKVLNKQEAKLKEEQNSLEKDTNNLKLKEKELNNKEQNIKVLENKLQAKEKNLANKEKEIKERESLQNELASLKKNNEKKVNELNLEVQTLRNKNSEQEKQISILASKNNDQKLVQMQERIGEITANNEKKVNTLNSEVQTLMNKNKEQEKELTNNKKSLNDKNKELEEMKTKAKELESQLKNTESQKDEFKQKVSTLESEVKNLQDKNNEQEKQISILNLKDNDEKLKQMTEKVNELTSRLANQNKEFKKQTQQLNNEKRDLENKLTNENNQLKEQAKTQKQLLDERQTEIQKLKEQNEELQKRSESTNVLPGNKQLQQEQKEKEDVNENKKLRIELITERLGNIKISNTSTILYIFAWMFQWASSTCKSYIEKASCEKNLVLQFKQLKQNLETNGENIVNDDGQLIEDTLTTLDSFMPKYCDDDMCEKLASLYSELLNLHEHNTKNIIDVFGKISNGEKYIELIKKNSVAKSPELDKTNNISENINLIK